MTFASYISITCVTFGRTAIASFWFRRFVRLQASGPLSDLQARPNVFHAQGVGYSYFSSDQGDLEK